MVWDLDRVAKFKHRVEKALARAGLAPLLEVALDRALAGTAYGGADAPRDEAACACACDAPARESAQLDGAPTGRLAAHCAAVVAAGEVWGGPPRAAAFGETEVSESVYVDVAINRALLDLRDRCTETRCGVRAARDFFERIGDDGLLRLATLRTTSSTIPGALPPLRAVLLEAADVRPTAGGPSAGAVAVAERGGKFFGPYAERGDAGAREVIARILGDGCWCNVHRLPDGAAVYEVRASTGHGAAWDLDYEAPRKRPAACAFRGLLDPPAGARYQRDWRYDPDSDSDWSIGPDDVEPFEKTLDNACEMWIPNPPHADGKYHYQHADRVGGKWVKVER